MIACLSGSDFVWLALYFAAVPLLAFIGLGALFVSFLLRARVWARWEGLVWRIVDRVVGGSSAGRREVLK